MDANHFDQNPTNTATRRQNDEALTLDVVPASQRLPRLRSQVSPEVIRTTADQIFEHMDPTMPAAHARMLRRELPRMYTPLVHGRVHKTLFQVMAGGTRLYMHGAAVGVGASMLATDTGRSFNARAKDRALPQRAVYLDVTAGIATEKDLLEALCRSVKAPLTFSERRNRSTYSIGERVVAAIHLLKIEVIILDHVHNASPRARGVVADLLRMTDPNYQVSIDVDSHTPPNGRLGIVVVDHQEPELLFKDHVDVLALLQGNYVSLDPYTSVEALGDILRQASVGMEDWDISDPADAEFTEHLLKATDGLIANIAGTLQLVDVVMATNNIRRPDISVLHMALRSYRKMTHLIAGKGSTGQTYFDTIPALSVRSARAIGKQKDGKAKGGKSKLRQRREAPSDAVAERNQMLRRGHTNLPELRSENAEGS